MAMSNVCLQACSWPWNTLIASVSTAMRTRSLVEVCIGVVYLVHLAKEAWKASQGSPQLLTRPASFDVGHDPLSDIGHTSSDGG